MTQLYVQFGCGFCAPDAWLNFDASPTLWFERLPVIGRLHTRNAQRFPPNVRFGDVVKGLPIPDDSAQAVYCSHMLDYLTPDELRMALANTHRMMRPGGVFRVVIEDCTRFLENYLQDSDAKACSRLMEQTGWGRTGRRTALSAIQYFIGHPHRLWFWDYKGLEFELSAAGFRDIRRAQFNDSEDKAFSLVEEISRWTDCIGVECTK